MDVREAAERLRRFESGESYERIYGPSGGRTFDREGDKVAVVAAYLAEHRADDRPSESAWLQYEDKIIAQVIPRVVEWMASRPRKHSSQAFTAGLERQIAQLIEAEMLDCIAREKEKNEMWERMSRVSSEDMN